MENYCKMQAAGTTQRLQWIDAMRGFSMLVVVFVHLLHGAMSHRMILLWYRL